MVNKTKSSPMTYSKTTWNPSMSKTTTYNHKNCIKKKFHLKAKLINSLDAKTTKDNSQVRISLYKFFLKLLNSFS